MPRTIRAATVDDATACAAVYAPYVRDTAISFEADPPTTAEMAERIAASSARHAWLVLEEDDPEDGRVVGYAYAGPYASRPAYDWSAEVSVYLDRGRLEAGLRRSGAGRALYEALFAVLEQRGLRMAVAGVTLPNEASLGLHRAMGFTEVGTLREIGFKAGAWHDVVRLQRPIGPRGGPPPPRS